MCGGHVQFSVVAPARPKRWVVFRGKGKAAYFRIAEAIMLDSDKDSDGDDDDNDNSGYNVARVDAL